MLLTDVYAASESLCPYHQLRNLIRFGGGVRARLARNLSGSATRFADIPVVFTSHSSKLVLLGDDVTPQ